jgi:hypothetical protein
MAKDGADERHLCPLQLDLIERAVTMWSNPGNVVLSPFMGIGSEGVTSLKLGRKFIGIELKPILLQARLPLSRRAGTARRSVRAGVPSSGKDQGHRRAQGKPAPLDA